MNGIVLSLVATAITLVWSAGTTNVAHCASGFSGLQVDLKPDTKPKYIRAQLRAKTDLQQVAFRFDNESWQPAVKSQEKPATHVMKHARAVYSGREVAVRAQNTRTDRWIVIRGKINADMKFEESERKIVSEEEATKLTGSKQAHPKAQTGGIGSRFLAELNNYRARMGRGSLTYDHSLEAIASRNNQAGGYHNYTGGTPQVWAFGSPSVTGTLRQWQNSPPHNAILLGGYRAVGIAFDGRNWTANFR